MQLYDQQWKLVHPTGVGLEQIFLTTFDIDFHDRKAYETLVDL